MRRAPKRIVHYLTAQVGIRQFLDIGSGLPSHGNAHEVAQEVDPATRVVYVDIDPVVLLQARDEVLAYFGDLDLLEPGLVPLPLWRSPGDSGDIALLGQSATLNPIHYSFMGGLAVKRR